MLLNFLLYSQSITFMNECLIIVYEDFSIIKQFLKL